MSTRRYIYDADIEARVPVSAVWELTLACDLSCTHCGSRAGRKRARELTTAEALHLAKELAALGVRDVGLIGGEAYLRKDWLEIIRAIRDAGMDCALQTGGRNLTDQRIRGAAEAGLQSIGVSLDGLRDVHDRLRGFAGSFDAAVGVLLRAAAAGIATTVNTQVNALSMPQLPALMETIIGTGATNWQLALTVAMGNAADNPEVLVQPHDLLELMPMLARLHAEARDRGVVVQPSNNIGYFGPHESQLRSVNDPAAHWSGCAAGENVIGIEADGTIKGCPGLSPVYAGGNVRERPLAEIWNDRKIAFMQTRTRDDLWGYCRDCYYGDVCLGGCTWTTHSLFGRPGNNPLCHYRALEMERRGVRERIVQVERAPGLPFDHGRFEIQLELATKQRGKVRLPVLPAGHG